MEYSENLIIEVIWMLPLRKTVSDQNKWTISGLTFILNKKCGSFTRNILIFLMDNT